MATTPPLKLEITKEQVMQNILDEIKREELEIHLMLLRDIRGVEDKVDCFKAIERLNAFLAALTKGVVCEGPSKPKC